MPTPDDERFELYLKQFRPLAPESLQSEKHGRATLRRLVLAAWVAAAAIVLVATVFMMRPRGKPTQSPDGTKSSGGVEQLTNAEPLTVSSANALLVHAPSFKAAVDLVAFQPQATRLSKGTHSALAVLSKENTPL